MAQRSILADPVTASSTTARLRFCVRDKVKKTAVSYILTVELGNGTIPDPNRWLLTHAVDGTGVADGCRTLGWSCIETHVAREAEAHTALEASLDSLWTFLESLL